MDNQQLGVGSKKKIFGGYSVVLAMGILSIFLAVMMVHGYYCKMARRIKKAIHLLRQATVLVTCLIFNVFIVIFATVVVTVVPVTEKYILLCILY